ncbi:low temperature requirement protein A [Micromonospora sp. NPDC049559]|uniref:low temperature requirement protein A n=1 Tax=Micromonospora sp. NPDC049559 TaxID=3155923 RepID=UPI0034291ADA
MAISDWLTGPPAGQGPTRATFLELFLDLVYVFAFTQLASRLIGDFTAQRRVLATEVGQTMLLLVALWLVWVMAARTTSAYDPQHPAVQISIFAITFGSMVIAVTLPHAFGPRGLTFAGTYVAVQVGRSALLWFVLRGSARLVPARTLCWTVVTAVPWLIGAAMFPQSPARGILWTIAIALDYLGLTFGWPTPWLGRSRLTDWRLRAEHFAERLQQFVNITLGESILVMGTAFAKQFTPSGVAPVVLSFVTTVLIWRIYFHRAGSVLGTAIARASRPALLGQSGIHTHFFMIAGIFVTGAGYELVIDQPFGELDPAWLWIILGGPALFLVARSRFEYEVFRRVPWSRIAAWGVLGALAPLLMRMPPVVATAAATAVLAAVAIWDAIRTRRHPDDLPAPPEMPA